MTIGELRIFSRSLDRPEMSDEKVLLELNEKKSGKLRLSSEAEGT